VVPVRIHPDFKRSVADVEDNRLGVGDLAKYLVLASYSIILKLVSDAEVDPDFRRSQLKVFTAN
jgi:hypothetical protein